MTSTMSTGGGHGHKTGCACPFCTSTATTGEVTIHLDLTPDEIRDLTGLDVTDAPGNDTDVDVAALDPTLDPDFDPIALAAEHDDHHMADKGIFTITLPDGRKTAWNTNGPNLLCPACLGEKEKQARCMDCVGRGVTQSVPFCDRPWDEPIPNLAVGGHDSQTGDCHVTDPFDVVISLYSREGFGPDEGVEHHTHTMIDGALDPADHERIHELADVAAAAVRDDKKVLVRCAAGMNRSGLVAGLAMMKLGWTFDEALTKMRAVRGPYVLFNDDFRAFLAAEEQSVHDRIRRDYPCASCNGAGGTSYGICWDCRGNGFC